MQNLFLEQKQLGIETDTESHGVVVSNPIRVHPQIVYRRTLSVHRLIVGTAA
jgi:hypothetical protein